MTVAFIGIDGPGRCTSPLQKLQSYVSYVYATMAPAEATNKTRGNHDTAVQMIRVSAAAAMDLHWLAVARIILDGRHTGVERNETILDGRHTDVL